MPDFSKRAEKKLQGRLDDGERFIVAGVVQPTGSISRGASDGTGFARAVIEATRARSGRVDQGRLADGVPTSNGYLAVTSHRLLWLDQGASGWPTDEIVFTCDRSEVTGATETKGRGFGGRSLVVEFEDGSRADLHVHRSQKPDRIAAAINQPPG